MNYFVGVKEVKNAHVTGDGVSDGDDCTVREPAVLVCPEASTAVRVRSVLVLRVIESVSVREVGHKLSI